MKFEDQGQWVFSPFERHGRRRKLNKIIDRNGNQLTLFYDAQGRLNRSADTLDRDIAIAYNSFRIHWQRYDFTAHRATNTITAPNRAEVWEAQVSHFARGCRNAERQ